MALSQFKYVGGKDRGINANKQQTLYGVVFPLGKAVEVPDELAHKMRVRVGYPDAEFEEVKTGPDLNEFEKQEQKQRVADEKLLAKKKANEKLTPEELDELKAVKAREDARVVKIQEDAKLGR